MEEPLLQLVIDDSGVKMNTTRRGILIEGREQLINAGRRHANQDDFIFKVGQRHLPRQHIHKGILGNVLDMTGPINPQEVLPTKGNGVILFGIGKGYGGKPQGNLATSDRINRPNQAITINGCINLANSRRRLAQGRDNDQLLTLLSQGLS